MLEEFHRDGRARSIGVSNFQVAHLRRLAAETDMVPAVNQIEVHPYLAQRGGARLRRRRTASRPRRGRRSPRAGCSTTRPSRDRRAGGQDPAQVTLRWHIQRGDIVFPKSTTPSRIKENFELFDFELTDDDLDCDQRAGQG